jgi:uncharacterized protein (DUF2062 family)
MRPIQTAAERAKAAITAQVSSENFRDVGRATLARRGVGAIGSGILLAPFADGSLVTRLRNFWMQKQKARRTACAVGWLEIRL